MTFKPGDAVKYQTGEHLCESFRKQCGLGPFIVKQTNSFGALLLNDINGSPLMNFDSPWTCTKDKLVSCEFEAAVYRRRHGK